MKLSVIIPTCNRADRLKECLRRIEGADEIVVTDDGDMTKTRELIQCEYKNILWVQGPRKGPAANRNRGACESTGDWFVFIDDDCLPSKHWLSEIRNAIAGCDVVEGKTICPDKTNHPFEDVVENLTGDLLWSCNLAVSRSLFERLGGVRRGFSDRRWRRSRIGTAIKDEQIQDSFRVRRNCLPSGASSVIPGLSG
jgi:glycosyltransferase involved in cell wall biosynthesis